MIQILMRLFSGLLGFATLSVLTRHLTPSDFGFYASLMTIIACLLPLAHLGLPTAILQQKSKLSLKSIFYNKFFLYFYPAYLIIFLIVILVIMTSVLQYPKEIVLLILLNVVVFCLFELLNSTLIRTNNAVKSQIVTLVLRPSLYIAFLYSWNHLELNLQKVLMLHAFALSGALGTLLFLSNKIAKSQKTSAEDSEILKLQQGLLALVGLGVLQLIFRNAEVLVASYFLNYADVGTIKVLTSFTIFIPSIVALINAKNSKNMLDHLDKGDTESVKSVVRQNEREMTLMSIGFTFVSIITLTFFGEKFFKLSLSDHYESVLVIFSTQIIFSKFGSRGYLLLLAKKQKTLLNNYIFSIFLMALMLAILDINSILKVVIVVSACLLVVIYRNNKQYQKLIGAIK